MKLNKLSIPFIIVGFIFLIIGCATSPKNKFNRLSIDMSKAEVIDLLGTPYSTSAKKGFEYLIYSYNRGPISGLPAPGGSEDYFVRIIKGKVESYGRVGDFNSTKDPESKIEININSKNLNPAENSL